MDSRAIFVIDAKQSGLVCIGYSEFGLEWFVDLQVDYPYPLDVGAYGPATFKQVEAFRQRMMQDRVRGYWYRITPAIDREMKRVMALPFKSKGKSKKARRTRSRQRRPN